MADWWEQAYKLGPPVPVPGFPRPVYPPDAAEAGRAPSVNGPDVEAYKRVVWRAGRWPGPASSFDRAYSNAFAHGKGSNVVNTGISGVQRQMGIDDTGWIGKATFDTLCRIRVPQGPHEGEPAMDANAANLVAQAWELYGGKEPAPPKPSLIQTVREQALAGARRHLGTVEKPAGSNHTMYGDWYGVDFQPWCAIFCSYCYEVEAGGSPSFRKGQNYAYCPYVVQDARNNRNGLSVTSSPLPGDLVVFDWGRDGTFDHIELFESGNATNFVTIGGNTSGEGIPGSQSNGGGVYRRNRSTSQGSIVFVRVAE